MNFVKLSVTLLSLILVFLFSENAFSIQYTSENNFYTSAESVNTEGSFENSGQDNGNKEKGTTGHGDKFAEIYLILFLIILGAVIGRRLIAKKLKQPEVLGELIIGVLLGLILYQLDNPILVILRHQDEIQHIVRTSVTENIKWDESIKKNLNAEAFENGGYGEVISEILTSPDFADNNLFAQIILLFSGFGVLVLLFLVGLETSFEEMFEVGGSALTAAVIGVAAPFVLGYLSTMFLFPEAGVNLYMFVGATLCATSIGITARVFKDLRRTNAPEAKLVLGAAVIDDVLGLIVLAVVAGIIESGELQFGNILLIVFKALVFLGLTFFIGKKYLRKQIKLASLVQGKNISILFPFSMMLLMAWISDSIGLASIVGAFAAGLIIKEEFFNDVIKDSSKSVKNVIEPIEAIFAPVFFVIMGLQVDLSVFLDTDILLVSLLLTLAAVIGKFGCGIFAKGMDKKIIGIGMIPRGEVGLIFASIGKSLGVLDNAMFSSIIIVVILTTFITPPALKWAFSHYDKKASVV
ncbi:MAG TPA: cation:proton antiporter [Ignavibacteria bacterium]|nr:cation:proton antiporter [Bacteroidota bacterium]HRI83817.1 cation:proton antiporter [Ignavibacteria bacterium]HRJ99948.1 cation:proton antiporter [Ignavibacteria bacterium]